jgi:hypothetical protein
MSPEEAAALALALTALCAPAPGLDRPRSSPWSRVDDPRTWADFARREALALDADI